MSTHYESTFARQPAAFLRSLKGQTRLIAQTIPHGSSAVEAEFDLTGIDEVIADVSRRCAWPRGGKAS